MAGITLTSSSVPQGQNNFSGGLNTTSGPLGLGDNEASDIQAALVFTNDATEVDADNAPIPTLHAKKLKDFIRKTAKNKPISMNKVQEIQEAIGE